MTLLPYFIVAYLLIGLSAAYGDFKQLRRGGLYQTTITDLARLVRILLSGPYRNIALSDHGRLGTIITKTTLVFISLLPLTAFCWGCVYLATFSFENLVLRFLGVILFFTIGFFIVMPVLNFLVMPLIVLAFALSGRLFPEKKQKSKLE